MAHASTEDVWFIDKLTNKIYRVVWMTDRAVLLEGDNSSHVFTSIKMLKTFYKPINAPILASRSDENML